MTVTAETPAAPLRQAATEMHDFAATTAADPWTKDFVLWPVSPAFIAALGDWMDAEATRAEQSGVVLHSLSPGPLAVARAYLDGADA